MSIRITKNHHHSRRNFLKYTALGAAGLGLGVSGLGNLLAASMGNTSLPIKKGRVVVVKRNGVMQSGRPDQEIVRKMVDEGMFALTGKNQTADAWRALFTPDDVVGIKINPLGGVKLTTKPEVVNAIIAGLIAAGVKENNIIIWDRFSYHLIQAGYPLNKGGSGVRCYGTEPTAGYDKGVFYESLDDDFNQREEDGSRSLFSSIVTKQVTAIINVPVLKDHGIAGVTLCLKNLAFGAINNTKRFHPSPYFCDPASAEVCAHPALRSKVRLHVADALQACFDGGPSGMKAWTMWDAEQLLFGTDPVAMDRIGLDLIEKQRKEHDLPSIFKKAKHIATGEHLGLGIFEKSNIEQIEITA